MHDDADVDGVPEETAGVIGGCLEKDPRFRPTAVEVRRALAEGGTGAEEPARWLPEPVLRLIAERSTAALDLPGIDDTEVSGESVSGDAAGTRGPGRSAPAVEGGNAADEPGAAAGRRRFLALSGGAALVAAGGGTALWAAVGREEAAPAVKPRRPRYTLALHADLSGADKATGRAQERGLRLAVEQFNAPADARTRSPSGRRTTAATHWPRPASRRRWRRTPRCSPSWAPPPTPPRKPA